ncbi:MAG: ATP-dependent Clp protease proteolytic subunit [Methyloprofundus sp.]|nr:ATP-dependent Clp protease proteolytic subunit [Methyloprofundus sp.]
MSNLLITGDRATITFSEEVSFASINALVKQVDMLANYYHIFHVCIEIDSPGGELKSLQLFLSKLKTWRSLGVVIETRAMTSVASAAAIMLSMGDVGFRYVMPDARILYHKVRVNGQMTVTADKAKRMFEDLERVDTQVFEDFFKHFQPSLKCHYRLDKAFPSRAIELGGQVIKPVAGRSYEAFEKKVKTFLNSLFECDDYLSAQQAVDLKLVDHVYQY